VRLLADRRPTTTVLEEGDMKMRIRQRFCNSAETGGPKPVQPVRLGLQIAAGLLLFANGACIFPARAVEPSPIIRVHVFNYTNATPSTVAQAEREAERILQGTGLNLDWLNCPIGQSAVNSSGSCPKLLSPTDVLVRVLSDQSRNGITGDAYGFANPPALASAYYDQAVRLATIDGAGYEVPLILGYVMAHEIGHLLLGARSHSEVGIMQGRWGRKQIKLLMRGRLGFTAQQSKLMRSEAYRRLMLETTQAVPTVPQALMETPLENASSAVTSETLPKTTAFVIASKEHLEPKDNLEPIEQHTHGPQLQVQVYDYAGLYPAAFEAFRRQLEEILVRNGLSVDVNLCTKPNSAQCDQPPAKSRCLLVRVVPRQPGTEANTSRLPLGQSFVDDVGGKYATVFLEPVVERATEADVSWEIVLGYAAAHEIGHLLLGSQAHTPWGLMKATWDHTDFVAMRQNKLPIELRTSRRVN
jgi:hypothetical protein